MQVTFVYCTEVRRWFCYGANHCGLGETKAAALQNWREDVRRTELERAARIAAIEER
jgi:hypothetical protein